MSLLPTNVGTGHVTGIFINTDGQAETGKAILRPRFTAAKITTAVPPATALPTPRSVPIDANGQMAETEVVATNDLDLGLEPWTYEVTFKFDSGVEYGPFDIDVPEGETVDLTLVAPATTSNGVQIVRGFGVPDTTTAVDGDVVTYDATAGATAWWSRTDAIGGSLTAEFEDPDSPLRVVIDESAGRVADEALESRLSRTDRTRHAPSLGLYFPEAEGGDVQAAINTAAPAGGTVPLTVHEISGTLTVPDGVTLQGGRLTTLTGGRMITLGNGATLDCVHIDPPGSVLGTMGAVEVTGDGAVIRNCRFESADRDAWQLSIQPTATNTLIENTIFARGNTCIHVNPGASGLTVRNCRFEDWTSRCINLNATTAGFFKIRIQDNEFGPLSAADTTADAVRCAVAIRSSQEDYRTSDIEISGNRVYGNGLGHSDTSMGPGDMLSLHRLDGARILNNYLIDPGEVGIHVGQGSRKVVLSGNIVLRADTTGIVVGEVTNTYRIKDVTATGNIVLDSQWDRVGDLPDSVTGGISFWHADGVVVTGNRSGNTEGNTTQGYGVKIVDCTEVSLGVNNASGARLGDVYVEASSIASGSGGELYAELAADHVVTNVADMSEAQAAATDTLLRVPVLPGSYDFRAHLIYYSRADADIQLKLIVPGQTTGRWVADGPPSTTTSPNTTLARATLVPNSIVTLGGTDSNVVALPEGRITFTQQGEFWIRFAQGTAQPTNAALRAESWITLTKVD